LASACPAHSLGVHEQDCCQIQEGRQGQAGCLPTPSPPPLTPLCYTRICQRWASSKPCACMHALLAPYARCGNVPALAKVRKADEAQKLFKLGQVLPTPDLEKAGGNLTSGGHPPYLSGFGTGCLNLLCYFAFHYCAPQSVLSQLALHNTAKQPAGFMRA